MSEVFHNAQAQRVIFLLQLSFFLLGLLALLMGVGRIAVELVPLLESQIPATQQELFTIPSLIIGIGLALIGYGSLYSMAAVGAKEPPALGAARNTLIALVLLLWIAAVWIATVNLRYFAIVLMLAILITALAVWLWSRVQSTNLWQVFGQRIHRSRGSSFIISIALGMTVVILIALGVIFGILNDYIELPVSDPEPGELLYISTFDNFNDEWDFPQGRQRAEIVDGAMLLSEGSGLYNSGFYALLEDRKFGDFDLRVIGAGVSGDPKNYYAVVFRRKDVDNYLRFEVNGVGYYRFTEVIDGNAETISPWIPSPIIRKAAESNEIRIVAVDDEIQFFINQQPVPLCTKGDNARAMIHPATLECLGEWEDAYHDETFHQGRIGLAVGTIPDTDLSQPVMVRFDNILIVGPE